MKTFITSIILLITVSALSQELNQVAFMPHSPKRAYLNKEYANKQFTILNDKGIDVLTGTSSKAVYWEPSGTKVCYTDFSVLKDEGRYTLVIDQNKRTFYIDNKKYRYIGESLLKSFYMARCSEEVLEKFAGNYARPLGHPDDVVYIHTSAADKNRKAESVISSPGGWYDAGDYGKYIVNSSISTFLFLHTYEVYADYYKNLAVNIPESNNGVSDILNEAVINIKWMLTMQDPNDGGVYHKLNSKRFGGMEMPHEDTAPRYVVMKTTPATLDFAATMAKAARILGQVKQYKNLAKECSNAAMKAYEWSLKNPEILYQQPEDIKTGEYKDTEIADEWFWAKTELYLTSKDAYYWEGNDLKAQKFNVPEWRKVNMLGIYSIANSKSNKLSNIDKESAESEILKLAKKRLQITSSQAYNTPIKKFPWGSNGEIANNGVLFLQAYKISDDKEFLFAADACASYLLGANATGYCFITGFGDKQVLNIHDRRCSADGNEFPIPGLLAGGPSTQALSDCGTDNYPSQYPAKAYLDAECSYSTNEWAINWNSAAMSLFLGLDACYKE